MSMLSPREFQALSNLIDAQLLRLIERVPSALSLDSGTGLQFDSQALTPDILRECISAAPAPETPPLPLEVEAKVLALIEDHIERVLSAAISHIKAHSQG